MLCVKCQEERDEKDFYGSPICYKCVYNEKAAWAKSQNVTKPLTKCFICQKPMKGKKYCSTACRRVPGAKSWTKQIHVPTLGDFRFIANK